MRRSHRNRSPRVVDLHSSIKWPSTAFPWNLHPAVQQPHLVCLLSGRLCRASRAVRYVLSANPVPTGRAFEMGVLNRAMPCARTDKYVTVKIQVTQFHLPWMNPFAVGSIVDESPFLAL